MRNRIYEKSEKWVRIVRAWLNPIAHIITSHVNGWLSLIDKHFFSSLTRSSIPLPLSPRPCRPSTPPSAGLSPLCSARCERRVWGMWCDVRGGTRWTKMEKKTGKCNKNKNQHDEHHNWIILRKQPDSLGVAFILFFVPIRQLVRLELLCVFKLMEVKGVSTESWWERNENGNFHPRWWEYQLTIDNSLGCFVAGS